MDRVLHFVTALAVVAVLALLVSSDRKNSHSLRHSVTCYRSITGTVLPELGCWPWLRKGFSEMFEKLLGFANEGTNFVFGSMNDQGLAVLLPESIVPIVFISALIGILQHIRVLPVVIRAIGFLLSKVNGMGKLESLTPSAR